MQWYPWPSETDASFRCKHCTGQARPTDGRLRTEVTVGRYKLEVVPSFCYLGDCLSSGANSMSSCRSSPPLISHHLQRKSLQFMCQRCHAPCKQNLGPNLIRFASPPMQWPSYDSLDVQCHHQGPKVTLHLHSQVERGDGWLKKVQKLNPSGGQGHGCPKKTS